MYERKIPLDLACGVNLAREVLAGKWKTSLLYYIARAASAPASFSRSCAMPRAGSFTYSSISWSSKA